MGPVFDFDDGSFIFPTAGDLGFDTDGGFHLRLGDFMSMDMNTGNLHFNSGWRNDDDRDQDF